MVREYGIFSYTENDLHNNHQVQASKHDLMILVPFTVPSRCELLRLSRSDCAALLNLDHAKIRVFEQ